MANSKPLMTPEQQTMFKQAVAQKAIEPLPYEQYCALSPEQADEIFKSLEGKVDFNQPLPERNSEKKLGPDDPATRFQKRAISEAVRNGIIDALPNDWFNDELTNSQASVIIKEIHEKRPPEIATESQKKEIDRLVKDGRIFGMKAETYHSLSKEKASELISIGQYNEREGKTVEGYDPDYISKRNQPKTPEQEAELKRLVAENRLNPVGRDKWGSLTQEEAGKLIFIGQRREEEGSLAPERDRSQGHEKEPEAPEPEKEPEKPKKSRGKKPEKPGNDMPM